MKRIVLAAILALAACNFMGSEPSEPSYANAKKTIFDTVPAWPQDSAKYASIGAYANVRYGELVVEVDTTGLASWGRFPTLGYCKGDVYFGKSEGAINYKEPPPEIEGEPYLGGIQPVTTGSNGLPSSATHVTILVRIDSAFTHYRLEIDCTSK